MLSKVLGKRNNIGHRKETRISEVKRYLWSLRKIGVLMEIKENRLIGDGKVTQTTTYIWAEKKVIQCYQYFSLREWKNDRIPHKKRNFIYRVIHEGEGKGTESNLTTHLIPPILPFTKDHLR